MSKKKKQETEAVESNVPQVKEANAVATEFQNQAAWGGSSQVSQQDIIIPRIFLMQPMSDKVTAGEAAFGEFRESLSNEKLGDFKEALNVIPFMMKKVFVEYELIPENNGKIKKVFIKQYPIVPANESLPYTDRMEIENRDGSNKRTADVSRDRVLQFYVLLPNEIDTGSALPYIISARRSSMQAGKKLATQMFVKNAMAGKTPASVMMKISSKKESNDEGTFAVLDVAPIGATPDKYVAEAFKWLNLLNQGAVKEHQEEGDAEFSGEASGATNVNAKDVNDVGPEKF